MGPNIQHLGEYFLFVRTRDKEIIKWPDHEAIYFFTQINQQIHPCFFYYKKTPFTIQFTKTLTFPVTRRHSSMDIFANKPI